MMAAAAKATGPRRIGVVTIGQTPRPDLIRPFVQAAEARSASSSAWMSPDIIQAGALDGLSRSDIDALHPQGDQPFYVTKLADGTTVKLVVDKLEQHLQRVLDTKMGDVDVIVIACTGTFPRLHPPEGCDAPLIIEPDTLLKGTVAGVNPRQLTVVVPDEAQVQPLTSAWREAVTDDVVGAVLSPYEDWTQVDGGARSNGAARNDERSSDLSAKVAAIAAGNPDLIVFDCMAYDEERLWPAVSHVTTVPVLFSASTVARIVMSMV